MYVDTLRSISCGHSHFIFIFNGQDLTKCDDIAERLTLLCFSFLFTSVLWRV